MRINFYGHTSFYYPESLIKNEIKKETRKVEKSHKTKSVIVDIKGKTQ